MKIRTLKNAYWCLLILLSGSTHIGLVAQLDSVNLIALGDTVEARKYIENNSFSDELIYNLWSNRTTRARRVYHKAAPYYYIKKMESIPESMSARERVELYTRYSVYATNKYILDKSLLYAYKAEDIAENEDDEYMRGKVNHALGWYYAANCDYARAHKTYDKAIQSFKTADYSKGVRNTMVKKAIAYHLQGQNKKSLDIYNEVNNLEDRISTLNDRALLIKSTFKNKDATKTKELLHEYFKHYNDKDTTSYQYFHMKAIEACVYKDEELELFYLNNAEKIAREHYQAKEHFSMLMNLGKYYLKRNDLDKAKEKFRNASAIAYKELMHNRFNEPTRHLLKIAEKQGNADEIKEYTAIQDYYFHVTEQKINVNNTIENNQKSILIRQKKEIQSQNQKIWILTALGFMGLGLLLFSFFYFRKYKKIVEDLSNKNNLLDESVKEKQTLLQETHHRVKNNLQIIASLLNLQRKYTKDKKLTAALVDGRNRVKSMALIHQLLYQKKDLKGINVRNYVENLMSSLFSSLKANVENIHFVNKVDPLNLHEDTLLSIGLIINEVVTNSLKYAFDNKRNGEIVITLIKKETQLFLSISDNGGGIPDDFDFNSNSSFGYSLITSLSKKLDASIDIFNQDGTSVILLINKFIEV